MTAQQLFKAEYRTARLYARREWVRSDDGAAMVRPNPKQAYAVPILAATDDVGAYRAATRAKFLRDLPDKLPSKPETVFFAAIDLHDDFLYSFDVLGKPAAAECYKARRAA